MGEKRTWPRRLAVAIVAVLALGLILVALAWWALRAPSVQQAVLGRLSSWTEAELGFALAADGFRLGLSTGTLEIDQPRLQVPGARPFASARRLSARWAPSAIFRRPLRLASLAVDRPTVDLGAPLPAGRQSPGQAPAASSLPFQVDRLSIADGTVIGGSAGAVSGWRLDELAAAAGFDGSRLSIERLSTAASLELAHRADAPVALAIALAGSAELDGTLDIASLRIAGEGLQAELSGHLDPAGEATRTAFEIAADPGLWLGGEPTGPVQVAGDLDLGAWRGTVTIGGGPQPATLLAGLLAAEQASALELAHSSLELAADLRLEADRAVVGTVRLGVLKDRTPVLDVVASPRVTLGGDLPAEVSAEVRILPGDPGQRRLTARLSSPKAGSLDDWRIAAGEAKLDQPAVEQLAGRFAGLYPRLLDPAATPELPTLGRLTGRGRFQGPLADPEIAAEAELQPHPGGRITLALSGRAVAGPLLLETTGSGLEIGHLTPAGLQGTLDWRGSVRDPLGAVAGSLELALRDLAGAGGPIVDSLTATISGDRERLDWRLEASGPGGAAGTGAGTVEPVLPLRRATAELALETGDPRLPRVAGTLELAGGALAATLQAAVAGRDPVTLELTLPLAALDALPQLAALAGLPVARRGGAIEIGWSAPDGDWTDVLAREPGSTITRLEGGSSGRASVDLACPACSTGSAEVRGFAVELDGRRAAAMGDLRLTLADGRLRVEPWSVSGAGLDLDVEGEVELSPSRETASDLADLATRVRAVLAASVDSAWLASLPLEILTPGVITVRAEVTGAPARLAGTAEIAAPGLVVAPAASPTLALAEPLATLSLADGILDWQGARLRVGDALLTSGGRARLAAPLDEVDGWLEVVSGMPALESLRLPFTLRAGVLEVAGGTIETTAGAGSLRLAVPVDGREESPARIAWELPANDWAPLLARLGGGQGLEVLELASRGSLALSLDRPALAEGSIVLDAGRLVMRGRETRFAPAIEIGVANGELRIAPFALSSAEGSFSFQARAALAPGWRPADPAAGLMVDFEVLGSGMIDAGLLSPFLAGGRAQGPLGLEIAVRGSPTSYAGEIHLAGPEASLLYRTPYLTRLQRPDLRFTITDGAIELAEGSAQLNEGALRLSGSIWREGRSDLRIELSEALFRLDYGLLATLGAELRFRRAADGSSTLAGTLDLERGALTRAVRLDLDFLSQLLAPIDLTTTEDDPLDLVALDIAVRTREGVRVKNNLGDLLVRWEPLDVTGTLARPIIQGRLEADPGGLLYLYGQTVRLDKATIEYPGQEGAEPQLDFEVTTSLEDPSIKPLTRADPFRDVAGSQPAAAPAASAAAADLARYVGDQFTGRVSETAGLRVSLRPLLIFGETDPGAQLTVERDLSPMLAIAAAVDLRNAQGRTYLLELHELRLLPHLVAQGYTNDQSAYGWALLQRQEFGGTKKATDGELARIAKILVKPPPGISKRGVKRALGLDRGDRFDPSQRFAAEVELVDYLLEKGYPEAAVTVRPTAFGSGGRKVAIEVDIAPGPHVRFAFTGEKIPKPLRPLITEIYRPDVFEPESIEELKAETVRALRSRGFLDPQVEVRVEPLDAARPDGARRVVIRTEGGIRSPPAAPVFQGVPPEDAAELGAIFLNTVQRIELAAGVPAADRRLLAALAGLGYPQARIARRRESLKDRALTVEIEPGPRQRIDSVGIDGEGDADVSAEGLEPLLTVAAGDPLRRSRLSSSALAIQRELNARGRLEASVRTLVTPADGADPQFVAVRFVVGPGPVSRLAELDFRGLRSTRERWARRVTGLETGQTLAGGDLAKARTQLWRTGLFSGVTTETSDLEPGSKRVVFDLTERDRFRLSYGVRWDSETGPGAVFDATNSNFLGRSWTLGLRALYSREESSLRGLVTIPRFFGGPGAVDLFAAAREVTENAVDVNFGPTEVVAEIREGSLQYSHPLSKRATVRIYGRYSESRRALPSMTLRVKNPQLGLQYVYDSRSPQPLSQHGILASVDLSGSGSFLGGDLRYARVFSQFNLYRPAGSLLGHGLSWSQSYRLGLANAVDQDLARDVRFFAGGEYSVRGYARDSLGEVETLGSLAQAAGGAAMLVLNQEISWRLWNDYALILFVDAGNVWQDTGELGRSLLKSTGIGLRAVTPVGLLRLDLAHALDRRPGVDPEYKLYFGLGASF